MNNKLTISLSPHIHGGDSVQRNMYGVLLALLPVLLSSFWFFGWGAVKITCVSVLACMAVEYATGRWLLQRKASTLSAGSAIVTGVLLAINLPSNLPLWMVVAGAVFAIGVVKMTFGGLGCNLFNPALAARAFMLVSFPAAMTTWPLSGQPFFTTDAQTGATPLTLIKEAAQTGNASLLDKLPPLEDMLIGCTGGSMGEVSALAVLMGLAFLLFKRIITWHIPVSIVGTVFVVSGVMHLLHPAYASPMVEVLSGGLLLGAVFMATDYVTSPMTPKGQLVYGVAIGVLTVVIRTFGAYPEGMSFAILIMNALTPLINRSCRPSLFGEKGGKNS